MPQAIIIGAGPAGLTAAYALLKQTDIHPIVLEQEDFVGGIARTMVHHGCHIDVGGHRFFSKDPRVMALWKELLPVQGAPSLDDRRLHRDCELQQGGPDPEQTDRVMLLRTRLSRIRYLHHFFAYPVSLSAETIRNLGSVQLFKVGISYLCACLHPREEKSLEDFMVNRFGEELYRMFFRDYTHKVWGRYPDAIDADWGSQRIKGVSILKALVNLFSSKKTSEKETSFIDRFLYPKYGPGQLWETMREEVEQMGGEVRLKSRVIRLLGTGEKLTGVVIETPDGEVTLEADYIFSSMPIAELADKLPDGALSDRAKTTAAQLPYRDFITVGILADKLSLTNETDQPTLGNIPPDCWIYVQEPDIRMGRLQIFNNWSPYLVPDPEHQVWLGLEYFCSEGDALWQMDDKNFIEMAIDELAKMGIIEKEHVRDAVRYRIEKAYPAYFDAYEAFPAVRAELDGIANLYCIGRNGQHRYNNMDHSMMTAFEAVRNIREHLPDKENVWNVNTEKDYQETQQVTKG